MLETPPCPPVPLLTMWTPAGFAAVVTVWPTAPVPPTGGWAACCWAGVPSWAVTQACCWADVPAFQLSSSVVCAAVAVLAFTASWSVLMVLISGGQPVQVPAAWAVSPSGATMATAATIAATPARPSRARTALRLCRTGAKTRAASIDILVTPQGPSNIGGNRAFQRRDRLSETAKSPAARKTSDASEHFRQITPVRIFGCFADGWRANRCSIRGSRFFVTARRARPRHRHAHRSATQGIQV